MSTTARLDLICNVLLSAQPINSVNIKTLSSVFNSIRLKALNEAVYPHLCGHLELLRTGNNPVTPCSQDSLSV